MKKSIFVSLACIGLLLAAFNLFSCNEPEETGTGQPGMTKNCSRPKFSNKQLITSCFMGSSCSVSLSTRSTIYSAKWKVVEGCSGTPYTTTVHYFIYKYTGLSGAYRQYNKIAGFSCASSTGGYAHSLLSNNSTFIILMDELTGSYPATINEDTLGYVYDTSGTPLGAADLWKFTTGNLAGMLCP